MINTKFPSSGVVNYYTKQEVQQLFVDLIYNAPESLDTLNELANSLAADYSNFAELVKGQLDLNTCLVYVDALSLKANITDMTASLALKADRSTAYAINQVDT